MVSAGDSGFRGRKIIKSREIFIFIKIPYNSPVKQLKILGVRIDDVTRQQVAENFATALRGTARFLRGKSFQHIATVNPEFLVEAEKNPKFRGILNKTALNICDGVGISIISYFLIFFSNSFAKATEDKSRVFYQRKVNRITGVEVAEILCRVCAEEGRSVYFLGGFGVAEKAAKKMQEKYPKLKIAGFEDGNPAKISDQLLAAKPDAILVAFGAPKQEFWLDKFPRKIPSLRIGIGIGGTFDFWAGKTKRAPQFIRKIGLEWLWRLILEPKIRGKRIWRAVFVFPYLVMRDFLKK